MDINDVRDGQSDDDDVIAHRARAAPMLDQIARDATVALTEHGIELLFLIPNSGRSILLFGTLADPPDDM